VQGTYNGFEILEKRLASLIH